MMGTQTKTCEMLNVAYSSAAAGGEWSEKVISGNLEGVKNRVSNGVSACSTKNMAFSEIIRLRFR